MRRCDVLPAGFNQVAVLCMLAVVEGAQGLEAAASQSAQVARGEPVAWACIMMLLYIRGAAHCMGLGSTAPVGTHASARRPSLEACPHQFPGLLLVCCLSGFHDT
jgi:hypothetical protein